MDFGRLERKIEGHRKSSAFLALDRDEFDLDYQIQILKKKKSDLIFNSIIRRITPQFQLWECSDEEV